MKNHRNHQKISRTKISVMETNIKGDNTLVLDEILCLDCAACVPVCAFDAIFLHAGGIEIIDDECTLCGICIQVCPTGALSSDEN